MYRPTATARASLAPPPPKARQLARLHGQLAQLQSALADLEDIARVTAVQADNIRVLGSLNGALYASRPARLPARPPADQSAG